MENQQKENIEINILIIGNTSMLKYIKYVLRVEKLL